jgi:hypothetical protein
VLHGNRQMLLIHLRKMKSTKFVNIMFQMRSIGLISAVCVNKSNYLLKRGMENIYCWPEWDKDVNNLAARKLYLLIEKSLFIDEK